MTQIRQLHTQQQHKARSRKPKMMSNTKKMRRRIDTEGPHSKLLEKVHKRGNHVRSGGQTLRWKRRGGKKRTSQGKRQTQSTEKTILKKTESI